MASALGHIAASQAGVEVESGIRAAVCGSRSGRGFRRLTAGLVPSAFGMVDCGKR